MARTMDIETLIEDALITALTPFMDSGIELIRWDDVKDKTLCPVIKVKAQSADEEQGTYNHFIGSTVLVDFGVFTSRRDDLNGRQASAIRGTVRSMLNQSDIVSQLNITSGLLVYNNGVIPSGSSEVEDPKMWQKNLTVLIIAKTEEP